MIIQSVSPYLIIDEIPKKTNANQDFVYIFTRPFSLSGLQYFPKLVIYTGAQIKCTIEKQCSEEINNCISVINVTGLAHFINMPDKSELLFRAFSTESVTGNFMLAFICDGDKILLYTGEYTQCLSIFQNVDLERMVKKTQIQSLYIDTTYANSEVYNNIDRTCQDIRDVLNKHKGYKIHLRVNGFGYEDLYIALSKYYGISVYVDRELRDIFSCEIYRQWFCSKTKANVIVIKENTLSMPFDEIERRYNIDKIIIMKLLKNKCLYNSAINNYRTNVNKGLCLIQYSPHPSQLDLYAFISWIKPISLHSITGNEGEIIPELLKRLCRNYSIPNELEKIEI